MIHATDCRGRHEPQSGIPHMRRFFQAVVRRTTCRALIFALVAMTLSTLQTELRAIEMFTYFGDGSRIGLPSLEVPIEAYPGIPLRSDRLRARRRAMRSGPMAARHHPERPRTGGGPDRREADRLNRGWRAVR